MNTLNTLNTLNSDDLFSTAEVVGFEPKLGSKKTSEMVKIAVIVVINRIGVSASNHTLNKTTHEPSHSGEIHSA